MKRKSRKSKCRTTEKQKVAAQSNDGLSPFCVLPSDFCDSSFASDYSFPPVFTRGGGRAQPEPSSRNCEPHAALRRLRRGFGCGGGATTAGTGVNS